MTTRTAVILAGGLGTRLRSAVPDLPKPMAPVEGRPFIEYLLDYWIKQGIEHFILSTGYRSEAISTHFGDRYRDVPLTYARESRPLGTGGGLLLAATYLSDADDSFLLLNGDTWFAVDMTCLERFARQRQAGWCLSLFRADAANRYMGIETDDTGRIQGFAPRRGEVGVLANGGVYWVRRASLDQWPYRPQQTVSLEDELLPWLQGNGTPVLGLEAGGKFIDIGLPHDYRRAGQLLVPACSPDPVVRSQLPIVKSCTQP
ncbi:sugar phosphate nucleotidyltransferase [Pseudomonas lactucae]|uniref:NTP transferase domain-containing protein n=1 Tax=Pseudomonas lactucae TaxID=2813360 RepID=A0A9X0Y8U6_9PSED|nr:sugar phosphate nucleotidyltransferase [Pseudomonas lactucae]MBN2975673.1 NTP transferase domain-containing protein [Pseudomonas lactucae]MBN2989001.1 NTP transferase domain-containing protein [Pseudomonas lactucae]